jgi:hypothetical protein
MSKIRMTSGHTRTDERQMHLILQKGAEMLNLTKERAYMALPHNKGIRKIVMWFNFQIFFASKGSY